MNGRDRRCAGIRQDRHKKQIERGWQHRDKVNWRPLVIGYNRQNRRAMTLAQRRRFHRSRHACAMIGHCRGRCPGWRTIHRTNRRRHHRLLEQQTERGQQGKNEAHGGMVPAWRLAVSG